MMDIDSPITSNHIIRNNHKPSIQKYASTNSILSHHHQQQDISSDSSFITESPSFLPKGTFKTKGKSRPDLLHIRTNSIKRPLSSSSFSIDSPTTSLAADLSQNFHIEKNNQDKVPTPKRSLLFANSIMSYHSPLVDNDNIENVMDISPLITKKERPMMRSSDSSSSAQLPFRKPFSNLSNSRGSSTSSLTTSSSIISTNSTSSISSAFPSTHNINASNSSFQIYNDNNDITTTNNATNNNNNNNNSNNNNAKPLQRRSVRRAFSSNTFSNRNASMINGSLFQPSLNLMSIDDGLDTFCVPSPIQERLTPTTEGLINSLNNNNDDDEHMLGSDSENDDSPSLKREVGSPIQQRISSKVKAARSKVRRTHSMFQNPQDYFTNDKLATSLINKISTNMTLLSFDNDSHGSTAAGNATIPSTSIKTISDPKNLIPRIDVDEFVNILDGKYSQFFDKIVIVDCRFEYEFNGGHIDGAINISSQSDLETEFLSEKVTSREPQQNKTLLIFHCEFSSYRGPLMANHLRKSDRLMNTDNYPNLYYPDILILEGGYKNFFDLQSHRCYPKFYVLMNDSKHQESCEIQMHRIRRDSKLQNSRSLKKAKSFHVCMPNQHSLHLRSRSQTIFQLTSSSSVASITSSTTSSSSSIAQQQTQSRPSSYQRARHSSSLFSLSKHHSVKFNQQRSSTQSLSSTTTTNTTGESDEENDLLSSFFSSNRDSDGISSFFDSQTASTNTLSSFLEDSHSSLDFKFPMKLKNISHSTPTVPTSVSANTTAPLKLTDSLKEHHDTPIMLHKKQKSSS